MFSRTEEYQRLDDHRDGARGRDHLADVYEIELLERDTVDRHHRVRQLELLDAVDADQAAYVAVADQDERQPAAERGGKARDHATAETVEPRERRRLAEAVAQRRGALARFEVQARKRRAYGGRDALRVDRVPVERELGRDHRDIAQGEHALRLDEV